MSTFPFTHLQKALLLVKGPEPQVFLSLGGGGGSPKGSAELISSRVASWGDRGRLVKDVRPELRVKAFPDSVFVCQSRGKTAFISRWSEAHVENAASKTAGGAEGRRQGFLPNKLLTVSNRAPQRQPWITAARLSEAPPPFEKRLCV